MHRTSMGMPSISRRAWLEAVATALAGLLPGVFAGRHALAAPDLDRDRALLRVLGGSATGVFRALDPIVARPVLLLPIATPAIRAAWVSAAMLALFCVALFRLGLAIGRRIDDKPGPEVLRTFVVLVGALIAGFATVAQMEASVCGGATLGALLAVAPTWAWVDGRPGPARTLRTALLFGLAVTYEPLVGAVAAALLLPLVGSTRAIASLRHPRFAFALSAGICVAALPPLMALLRRRVAPELELPGGVFAHPISESYQLGTKNPWPLALRELGIVAMVFAAVGGAIAVHRDRRLGLALVLATAVGFAGVRVGATATEGHAASSVLAALGAASVLTGAGMYALASRVAAARVPFARASASLLVLLDLAIVARSADDASLALAERSAAPTSAWERSFGSGFSPGAIVLVPRRDVYEHALAARARGTVDPSVLLVPLFDAGGSAAVAALRVEPKLSGVLRDIALEGAPSEWALSDLATAREVDVVFDQTWSRSVARHFVPAGLSLRFSIEPRGPSDRRAARESGLADLKSLPTKVKDHGDLRAATVTLLRLRAIAAAIADDHEATTLALADVRLVAPRDDLATRVAPPPAPKLEPAPVHPRRDALR